MVGSELRFQNMVRSESGFQNIVDSGIVYKIKKVYYLFFILKTRVSDPDPAVLLGKWLILLGKD